MLRSWKTSISRLVTHSINAPSLSRRKRSDVLVEQAEQPQLVLMAQWPGKQSRNRALVMVSKQLSSADGDGLRKLAQSFDQSRGLSGFRQVKRQEAYMGISTNI